VKATNFFSVVFLCFFLFSCSGPITKDEDAKASKQSKAITKGKYAKATKERKGYILGSEDVIEVMVFKEEELSKTIVIRPDGKISLPLVGDTRAAGLEVEELREDITEKLKEFVDNPNVSVIVLQANSMKIFVQGEVAQPGVYQLGSDTTLLHAISLAGGFNEWAKKKKIIVMREAGGKTLRITVDYEKIIADKKMNQNIVLERGDTIIVP